MGPEELARRVCHRAKPLERALASGGHTTMSLVGGRDNPIRDGLPEHANGWPKVLGDGATRDVDAAVTDIVVAPSAAGLRVFTRRPCGC